MTAIGISRLHPPVLSVGFPLLVRTDEEIDELLERLGPRLEAGIESSGYKLVSWSTSGWIYYYSRRPVSGPDDLKAQKLWMWEGATVRSMRCGRPWASRSCPSRPPTS
jgi:TRAP-type C4-dicarboxylate transport system substrate-binding protein